MTVCRITTLVNEGLFAKNLYMAVRTLQTLVLRISEPNIFVEVNIYMVMYLQESLP